MTTEKKPSPTENQEAVKPARASSEPNNKQCTGDGDCPPGQTCVDGYCK